jgi:hypothetical protein
VHVPASSVVVVDGVEILDVVELSTDVVAGSSLVVVVDSGMVVGKGVGSGVGVGSGGGVGVICAAAGGAIARLQHMVKPISPNNTKAIKEYLYLIIETPQFSDQWF